MTTHGECNKTVEYGAWRSMMRRCYNISHEGFKNYGDRGIKVCEEWHDYEKFLADMGRKPGKEYTLGRIDNNGNYEKANCEWQTYTKQERSRRNNKLTLAKAREIRMLYGMGYSQKVIAKEFGVAQGLVGRIINNQNWKEGEE